MMQSHEFYQTAIKAANAKKLASSLGISLAHAYRYAKPEDDGGSRNDLDGVVALIDLLAAYSRPTLVLLRAFLDMHFTRAMGVEQSDAPCVTSLPRKGGAAMKELAEFISVLDPERMDTVCVAREGAEAVNAVESLFRDAMHALTMQAREPMLKRAG